MHYIKATKLLHKPLRAVFPIVQRGALQKRFTHCACCTLSTGRLLRCSSRSLSLCHSQLRFSSLSAYVCCASLSVPVLLSHSCLLVASLNLLSPQCLPAYSWQQQIVFRHFVLFRTFAVSNTWQQHKRASERVSARATDNCESTDWESATALPLQKRTHLSVCERERGTECVSLAHLHSALSTHAAWLLLSMLMLPPPVVFCLLFCGRRWQGHWKMSPCKCDAYRGLATIQGDLLEWALLWRLFK